MARNLTQIISYDAYSKAEAFLTQPILAVAGSVAGSKWMSDDLLARAASQDKQMHIVEGGQTTCRYTTCRSMWRKPCPCSHRFSGAR
ncbi:hypothetical protein ACFFYR_09760 [Paraburkholderia dipogonis]|uniref:hypothetical protein n=1 Tax=Paraburkholderia dipogonis TaxID=1211383 RepID=UPI0035E9B167